MNNQNNVNINNDLNNVNVSNQQTTNLPGSQIVNNNTMVSVENNSNVNNVNNNNNNKNDGWFKYILAFIFLISIIVFVLFLPNITEFIESKKTKTDNNQNLIENGILLCTKMTTVDNSDTNSEIVI